MLLTTFAMARESPATGRPGAAVGSAGTYFLTPASPGMQFEVDSGNAMTSVDRMPRDGYTQHISDFPGGRLCGS